MDWLLSKSFRLTITPLIFAVVGTLCTPDTCEAAKKKSSESGIKTKKKKKSKKKKAPSEEALPTDAVDSNNQTDPTAVPPPTGADAKKVEVLLNLGLAPNPLLGFGGTGGYFLNPSLALEVYFSMASGKSDVVAISTTTFGSRMRKSFGKIPYIATGLALRNVSTKWNNLSASGDEEYPAGTTSSAVVLDAALGGQFRLGSILLGADVAGIMYPLFKLSNSEQVPEQTYDQADFDEQKAKGNKFNGMSLVLFKVGVGIAF